MNTDGIKWWPIATVTKYNDDLMVDISRFLEKEATEVTQADLDFLTREHGLHPDEVLVREGNALVTGGKTRIGDLLIGTGAQALSSTRAVVGVGTSNTATTAGMTSLQGTAYYNSTTGAPGNASGVISASSLFAAGTASHAWEEWCWAIAGGTIVPGTNFTTATASGVMLNRAVQSLGSKGAGAAWTLSSSITIS